MKTTMYKPSSILSVIILGNLFILGASIPTKRECGPPPEIENAELHDSTKRVRYPVGSTIYYTCDVGYGLEGDPRMNCISTSGTFVWTAQKFSCNSITCRKPEVPENGRVIGTDYKFGMLITFECNLGYKMWSPILEREITVPPVRSCSADGEWNGYTPICTPVTCPEPDVIENGWFYAPSNIYLSKMYYNCFEGYDLIGPKERRCEDSGDWNGEIPECVLATTTTITNTITESTPATCPELEYIENGWYQISSVDDFSRIYYHCNEGYDLIGSKEIQCKETGVWSGETPKCVRTNIIKSTPTPKEKKPSLWQRIKDFGAKVIQKVTSTWKVIFN